jgi:hypothetical protein
MGECCVCGVGAGFAGGDEDVCFAVGGGGLYGHGAFGGVVVVLASVDAWASRGVAVVVGCVDGGGWFGGAESDVSIELDMKPADGTYTVQSFSVCVTVPSVSVELTRT